MPIFIGHFGCNEHRSKFVYVLAYEYACLSTIPLSFVVKSTFKPHMEKLTLG